jgi:hypothetical protein
VSLAPLAMAALDALPVTAKSAPVVTGVGVAVGTGTGVGVAVGTGVGVAVGTGVGVAVGAGVGVAVGTGVGFGAGATVTVCGQLVDLPEASVAVQVTVVVPTVKLAGALLLTTGAGSRLSRTLVGVPRAMGLPSTMLTLAGQVRLGGAVSMRTSTDRVVMPPALVATH